ncbi:MAG: MFS transporter [Betaproteobacteria bacterium]|nr:MAG: MFS transporter [Betaproteobacteria bacterium]
MNAGTGLVVILLAQDLGARPVDIGLIFSIGGIGGILGSLIGGRVQKRFSFGQAIVALMWIEALLFPLYAIVPQYLLLGVVFALIYFIGPIYNVVQFSYRLALIPDALQGRVNSTFRHEAAGALSQPRRCLRCRTSASP